MCETEITQQHSPILCQQHIARLQILSSATIQHAHTHNRQMEGVSRAFIKQHIQQQQQPEHRQLQQTAATDSMNDWWLQTVEFHECCGDIDRDGDLHTESECEQ